MRSYCWQNFKVPNMSSRYLTSKCKIYCSVYVQEKFSERRKTKLFVVMECGDIDLSAFMQNKSDQIDDKFIKYHWQEMLKCVKVIHDRSNWNFAPKEHINCFFSDIVHSDLKPANFLFVGASLKLIDFGIASNIPSNKTSVVKNIQVGTLNYISPEAINGSYTNSRGETIYKVKRKIIFSLIDQI